jgi:hypothetical protein
MVSLSGLQATGSSLLPADLGRDLADAATAKQCETTCKNSSFFFMMVYSIVAIEYPQDPQTTMNTMNTVPGNL